MRGQADLRTLQQGFDGHIQRIAIGRSSHQLVELGEVVAAQFFSQDIDRVLMPARVDDTQMTEVEPQWLGPEPVELPDRLVPFS